MYSYISDELPKSLFEHFKELDGNRVSITGHSMGGHGALTLVSASFLVNFDPVVLLHLLTFRSFLEIQENTRAVQHLHQFPTQSTYLGAKKHSKDT